MIRLTTPRHQFSFPIDPSSYTGIRVTYTQNNEIILQKTEEDMTFENTETKHIAYYRLSQEETSRFRSDVNVKIQVHVKDAEDNVYASDIIMLKVQEILDDEEM